MGRRFEGRALPRWSPNLRSKGALRFPDGVPFFSTHPRRSGEPPGPGQGWGLNSSNSSNNNNDDNNNTKILSSSSSSSNNNNNSTYIVVIIIVIIAMSIIMVVILLPGSRRLCCEKGHRGVGPPPSGSPPRSRKRSARCTCSLPCVCFRYQRALRRLALLSPALDEFLAAGSLHAFCAVSLACVADQE